MGRSGIPASGPSPAVRRSAGHHDGEGRHQDQAGAEEEDLEWQGQVALWAHPVRGSQAGG